MNPIFKIPSYKLDFYCDLNGFRQENMRKDALHVSHGNLSVITNLVTNDLKFRTVDRKMLSVYRLLVHYLGCGV